MSITVFGYWRSSATWRVRIALGLKGLSFDVVPVHLVHNEQLAEPHLARNPMGQVPAVELDGHMLTQSVAILEYLEETQPSPPLLPAEPVQRARVRQAEVINSGIQPASHTLRRLIGVWVERSAGRRGRARIQRGFEALESLYAPAVHTDGRQVTFADIACARCITQTAVTERSVPSRATAPVTAFCCAPDRARRTRRYIARITRLPRTGNCHHPKAPVRRSSPPHPVPPQRKRVQNHTVGIGGFNTIDLAAVFETDHMCYPDSAPHSRTRERTVPRVSKSSIHDFCSGPNYEHSRPNALTVRFEPIARSTDDDASLP